MLLLHLKDIKLPDCKKLIVGFSDITALLLWATKVG